MRHALSQTEDAREMDVQTQPQLIDPSGYIGIALSDLGAHIEAL